MTYLGHLICVVMLITKIRCNDVPYHLRFRQQQCCTCEIDRTVPLPGTASSELPNL